MRVVLACDVGERRTGVALADVRDGTVVALDTLVAEGEEAMARGIGELVEKHGTDVVVFGLPLLPGGEEGAQAAYVRRVAGHLALAPERLVFLDERYTTDTSKLTNGDAKAACDLADVYLARRDLTKT